MDKQEKIDYANQIAEDLENAGYEPLDEEEGDTPEDLSDTELDLLMQQFLTKAKRPRRPIGVI